MEKKQTQNKPPPPPRYKLGYISWKQFVIIEEYESNVRYALCFIGKEYLKILYNV
jgi:hypothetical protein